MKIQKIHFGDNLSVSTNFSQSSLDIGRKTGLITTLDDLHSQEHFKDLSFKDQIRIIEDLEQGIQYISSSLLFFTQSGSYVRESVFPGYSEQFVDVFICFVYLFPRKTDISQLYSLCTLIKIEIYGNTLCFLIFIVRL